MRILVTGSREWTDYTAIKNAIVAHGATFIIEGGAAGADTYAKLAAKELGLPFETFDADWTRYRKAAGPIRNQRMLDEGKPDLVLAFPLPGCRGTWDMVRRAKKAGVEVKIFKP